MDIEFTEFGIMGCFVISLVIRCVLIADVGVGGVLLRSSRTKSGQTCLL